MASTRRTDAPDHRSCPHDSVDALLASWADRRPDLDFSPVGIVARLGRVRGHIDAALDEVFAAHELSAADFGVLVTLARIGGDGGVSQRRLMDELGVTSGTISVRMDRLVDERLVERRVDPESRRTTLITLTERGRELFERVAPRHLANERRLLAALSDEEERTLAALLRKLLVEFEGSVATGEATSHLGLTVTPAHVAMAMREQVGLPPAAGLLVRAVHDGGPAARAGVRTGDVLLRAGGRGLRSAAALYAALEEGGPRLRVTLLRGSDEHQVTLGLGDAGTAAGPLAATTGRTAGAQHQV